MKITEERGGLLSEYARRNSGVFDFEIFIFVGARFEWDKFANNGKGPKMLKMNHLLNAQVEKPLLRNHDFQGQPQVALNFNLRLTRE